jgi:hypothetical protein
MTNLLCLHELARGFYPLLVQSVCVFVALSYNTILPVYCQLLFSIPIFLGLLQDTITLILSAEWYRRLKLRLNRKF